MNDPIDASTDKLVIPLLFAIMMETAAPSLGAPDLVVNGISSSPPLIIIDPAKIVEHLAAVVTITLGASREDLRREGNLLSPESHADTVQRCTRFASDSQVALYIQKEIVTGSDVVEDGSLDNGK